MTTTGEKISNSIGDKAKNLKDRDGKPAPVRKDIAVGQYVRCRILDRIARAQEGVASFVLKGGMLHLLAEGLGTSRPTSDIDIHSHDMDLIEDLDWRVREILNATYYTEEGVVDDGVSIESITPQGLEHSGGEGRRYWIRAWVGKTRVDSHIDIGFGGTPCPDLEYRELPTFGQKVPTTSILSYPDHYMLAEKLHAVQQHGMANTRIRDFYDLCFMLRNGRADLNKVEDALVKTHTDRGSEIELYPAGLTSAFAEKMGDNWDMWHERQGVRRQCSLSEAVAEISAAYGPVLARARRKMDLQAVKQRDYAVESPAYRPPTMAF